MVNMDGTNWVILHGLHLFGNAWKVIHLDDDDVLIDVAL